MPCYHPLYAIPKLHPDGSPVLNPDTGKQQLRIVPAEVMNDFVKSSASPFHNPDVKQVPCGKCIGCRLAYSRTWANRLMLEFQYYPDSQRYRPLIPTCHFVTLTYNDWHVPLVRAASPDTGRSHEFMSLCLRDVQLFFKRLRKARPDCKIRYYLAGEYGEHTFRPHYHAIIFGLPLDDLQLLEVNDRGDPYYTSQFLESVWSASFDVSRLPPEFRFTDGCESSDTLLADPVLRKIGNVVIGPVTWDTCAYTARYVVKKLNGPLAKWYDDRNLVRPFSIMSRKPGIGRQYYDDHKDEIFRHEFLNIATPDGGKKFAPPRYFRNLYEVDFPDAAKELFDNKSRLSNMALKAQFRPTPQLPYSAQLAVLEAQQVDRSKSLLRRLC